MPKTEREPHSGVKTTLVGHAQNSQQLMEHIKKLEVERADNLLERKVLESKLRGYQTLGNLLQEAKQELRKYKAQNEELLEQLASLSSSQSSIRSKTTTSPVTPEGAAAPSSGSEMIVGASAKTQDNDNKIDATDTTEGKVVGQKLMVSSVDSGDIYDIKHGGTPSSEDSVEQISGDRVGSELSVETTQTVVSSSLDKPRDLAEDGLKSLERLSIAHQPSENTIFQENNMGGGQTLESSSHTESTLVKGMTKKDNDPRVGETTPPVKSIEGETVNHDDGMRLPTRPIQQSPALQPRLPSFDDTWEVSGCLTVDSAAFDDEYCVQVASVSDSSSEDSTGDSLSLPHFRSSSCSSSSIQPITPETGTSLHPNPGNPQDHAAAHESNVSLQVQDLSKVLTDAVGMDSTSNFASKLTRISLDALRMEKQLKTCQTLIESLSSENERLKVRLHIAVPEKDRLNATLRMENDKLLKKVQQLERDWDQMPPVRETTPNNGWVHVNQKQVQEGAAKDEASPSDTSGLQQKYKIMKDNVQELSKANDKWAEHCYRMKTDFETKVETLQRDLALCRSQLSEKEEQEQKRQADIDRILLTAKKRAEDAEAAREEALNSLHLERQRRGHFEELHALEVERCAELEERLHQMESQGAGQAEAGNASVMSLSRASCLDSLATMSATDLRTEVQVLRQQILIYKDDFDTERHDREKAQHDLDDVKIQLARFRQERNQEQNRMANLIRELERVKEENTQLEVDLAMKREEITRMEAEHRRLYPAPQAPPTVPSTWNPSGEVARPGPALKWNCTRCTYENIPQRTTCELCGKGRAVTPKEGWRCPSCTYQNPAGQLRCSICDQINPSEPMDPWRRNLLRERAGHRQLVSRGGEECDDAAKRTQATPRYSGYTPLQDRADDLVIDSLSPDVPTG